MQSEECKMETVGARFEARLRSANLISVPPQSVENNARNSQAALRSEDVAPERGFDWSGLVSTKPRLRRCEPASSWFIPRGKLALMEARPPCQW
jgi:hypothetical protein